MMKFPRRFTRRQQKGAVTLIITLLVMIAITIGSLGMVQTSMIETRMTANDQRSREALQAAQAGVDFVLANLVATPVDKTILCQEGDATLAAFDFQLSFLGPDEDEINFDIAANRDFCNSLDYLFIRQMDIWSRGYSSDRESVRTLMSTVDILPPWDMLFSRTGDNPFAGDPAARPPIVARGNVHFQGAPETSLCSLDAASATYCQTLATPGNVTGEIPEDEVLVLAGGSITQQAGQGDSMPMGSENFSTDPDLVSMDSDLFFETYVSGGVSKEDFLAQATEYGGQTTEIPSTGWLKVDGDLTLTNQVIGTMENPVTLVISGNLEFLGNATIWGIVYVEGDADFSRGTSKIMGSLVVEGDVDMRGNSAVIHNPELAGRGGDPEPELVDPTEFWLEYAGIRSTSLRIGSWREVLN
jgi:hypothetical protein